MSISFRQERDMLRSSAATFIEFADLLEKLDSPEAAIEDLSILAAGLPHLMARLGALAEKASGRAVQLAKR